MRIDLLRINWNQLRTRILFYYTRIHVTGLVLLSLERGEDGDWTIGVGATSSEEPTIVVVDAREDGVEDGSITTGGCLGLPSKLLASLSLQEASSPKKKAWAAKEFSFLKTQIRSSFLCQCAPLFQKRVSTIHTNSRKW